MKAILLALLSTQALANTVYVGDYSLSSVAVKPPNLTVKKANSPNRFTMQAGLN